MVEGLMGIYFSKYPNPCPRCGGVQVSSTFISVSPMSFSVACAQCGANDFSREEINALGDGIAYSPWVNDNPEWESGVSELD